MSPIAGAKKEDAVAPFSLDPSFDYDAPVENTTRFSVARALEEGEYYDRLMQEAVSPSKERTMMNPSGAPAASKKSGCPLAALIGGVGSRVGGGGPASGEFVVSTEVE